MDAPADDGPFAQVTIDGPEPGDATTLWVPASLRDGTLTVSLVGIPLPSDAALTIRIGAPVAA